MATLMPSDYYLTSAGKKNSPKTGGVDNSIVDIVNFKDGWYNHQNDTGRRDDDDILTVYSRFKHIAHNSWLFDIDTMHDTINPHAMPVDSINDFLVRGSTKTNNATFDENTHPKVVLIRNKIKSAKILNRNDIDILDDKYTIIKDYGPGSHLLTLDCLIDSASTPSIKKFLKKKGDFFNIHEKGSCITRSQNTGPKPRTFDLTPSIGSCVDNNSSISGVDISLYEYLYEKYKDEDVFPDTKNDSESTNLILLNYIWQLNLYYCISKCVKPKKNEKTSYKTSYSKALLTLNRLAFTGFEKTPGSFVPKFSYKIKDDNDDVKSSIIKIQKIFLDKLKQDEYVSGSDVKIFIENLQQLKEKKQFVFNISQAEVAKHIIHILQKRNLSDGEMAYNTANIISRNDGENVTDKDKTIQVLTNNYFKFFGNNKDDSTYIQYIFMLRLLKFMGDRSHIVMAKLVEKASEYEDNILSPILYTGERPLQVSSINEGLNTVMQHVNVHNDLLSPLSPAEHRDFLFCNSGLKPKEFSKLVCSKIISAFCWYYLQTTGNEPSDSYNIVHTITHTITHIDNEINTHSISLNITFNKDNIVDINFIDSSNKKFDESIKFFTDNTQKNALSSLESVDLSKANSFFEQNRNSGFSSTIHIVQNSPAILTDFFDQSTVNISEDIQKYNDYKVINNIEFRDMFTEFYGKTIKKLSGKRHLLELRRWIFQMLSINDKRPKTGTIITKDKNNPIAAFFYFLCTSEEFGQGRSTLLILNTLENALKQLEILYAKKNDSGLNQLSRTKAGIVYEDLSGKLSSIKPIVDLFYAVNLKVDTNGVSEIKDTIKCNIDDERNFGNNDLDVKLAKQDYLFNTTFKANLNKIPHNEVMEERPSLMTFRKNTGEWNKYCCNPKLLSLNGIEDAINYISRNPIHGSDGDGDSDNGKQQDVNNCVVNHESRLNIYSKLLDIRKLFYTSRLFNTDSAKDEIENIEKDTIIEEVCLNTMGDQTEIIGRILEISASKTLAESSEYEFVLSSDTKTKIDVNYKNLFDKISENYDYYKSDEITLDDRKTHLIELGKRFLRKGYEIYNYVTKPRIQDGGMQTPTKSKLLSNPPAVVYKKLPPRIYESLKDPEWSQIQNHFLFNRIVEYLINIHFEKYLEDNGEDAKITKDYISTNSMDNYTTSNESYDSLKNESYDSLKNNLLNPTFVPIPQMSDLYRYMDLFNSHIYSIPITRDCPNIDQKKTARKLDFGAAFDFVEEPRRRRPRGMSPPRSPSRSRSRERN